MMFPVTYFLRKFFPASLFSGSTEASGPNFADMAAVMTGAGTMAGALRATGTLRSTMAGSGTMNGILSGTIRQDTPPLTVTGFSGWSSRYTLSEHRAIFADMSAVMTGAGTMVGGLRATGSLRSTMVGQGSMRAMPILDISRLVRRRRDEDEMMAVLLAVG
jgi:hypothetical protein